MVRGEGKGYHNPEYHNLLTFMRAVSPPRVWAFTDAPASRRMATVVRKFCTKQDEL